MGDEKSGMTGGHDIPLPPVSEGQELEVEILSRGEKGDGIARVSGFVVFVPEAEAGTKARVKVRKVMKRFAVGELVVPSIKAEDNKEDKTKAVNTDSSSPPDADDASVKGEEEEEEDAAEGLPL